MNNNENNINNSNSSQQQTNWESVLNEFSDGTNENPAQQQVSPEVQETPLSQPTVQPVAPMQASASQTPVYDASSFPASEAVWTPIKSTRKNPLIIVLIAVLILAVLGGGFILLWQNDLIPFLSKKTPYEKAERNSLSQMETNYNQLKSLANATTYDVDMTITPGDMAAKWLYMDSVTPTTIKGQLSINDDKIYQDFSLSTGSDTYLSWKFWQDGLKFAAQLPDISDIYMKFDAAEIMEQNKQIDDSNQSFTAFKFKKMMSANASTVNPFENVDLSGFNMTAFDYTVLKDAINLWSDKYFEILGEGETENNVTVTAGDLSTNCKSVLFSITQEQIIKMAKAFISENEKNQPFLDMIEEMGLTDAYSKLPAALDSLSDSLKGVTVVMFKMRVYIKDNQIIGRDIYCDTDYLNSTFSLKYLTVTENGKSTTTFESANGDDIAKIIANSTIDNNAYTGKATVTVIDSSSETQTITVDYENVKLENNMISGNITVTCPENIVLSLKSAIEDKTQKINLSVAKDNANYVTIDAAVTKTETVDESKMAFPELTADNSISLVTSDNSDAVTEKFKSDIETNVQKLMDKINALEKPDIVCATIKMLTTSLNDMGNNDMIADNEDVDQTTDSTPTYEQYDEEDGEIYSLDLDLSQYKFYVDAKEISYPINLKYLKKAFPKMVTTKVNSMDSEMFENGNTILAVTNDSNSILPASVCKYFYLQSADTFLGINGITNGSTISEVIDKLNLNTDKNVSQIEISDNANGIMLELAFSNETLSSIGISNFSQ